MGFFGTYLFDGQRWMPHDTDKHIPANRFGHRRHLVPRQNPAPQARPGDRPLGHAARRYSLIAPPSIRLRRIGAARSIITPGSWIGGRCCSLWCARCSLKWRT